jgi:Zn-dependent protease
MLAEQAKALEARGDLETARKRWSEALPFLPASAKQSEWIRDHLASLRLAESRQHDQQPAWVKKLGPLAPIAVLLAKSKALLALFKLQFLLSLFAFIGFYWAAFGMRFGIGFALLVLIHEMGHFIDVKRRGLPADMPVFLPGFGAYVRWRALGVSTQVRAAVSLAGPLAGTLAAAACALVWYATGNALWAALARASAWLNILNLIPVWALDGGQAAFALTKAERVLILTVSLLLWAFLGESVFFLVALGAGWRLLTKDVPEESGLRTAAYFVALLVSLGAVMRLIPGQGMVR